MLPPGAFWAHGASKMATLGASLLPCILQCFRALEDMLPPGACCTSRASAKRIVSCRCLCVSSLCPQIPHAPAPTFGGFRNVMPKTPFPEVRLRHWCSVLSVIFVANLLRAKLPESEKAHSLLN